MSPAATRSIAIVMLLSAAPGCAPIDDEVDSTAQEVLVTTVTACASIPRPTPALVCQGAATSTWYTFPPSQVLRTCGKNADCVVQRYTYDVCGNIRATAITDTASNRVAFQRMAQTSCSGYDASRCAAFGSTTVTTDSGRVLSNKLNAPGTPPVALCCDRTCVAW